MVPADSVFAGVTSSLDIFPTICAAAGIDLPPAMQLDGVDLTPFLTGKIEGSPHVTLFWSNGPNLAIRKGDWKLIKSHDSVWLFDLSQDIGETTNLAGKHPEIVEDLERELQQWRAPLAQPAWPSMRDPSKVSIDGLDYEINI
jgi:arylsulfatase A-like enzyme